MSTDVEPWTMSSMCGQLRVPELRFSDCLTVILASSTKHPFGP